MNVSAHVMLVKIEYEDAFEDGNDYGNRYGVMY
jgi:hypothetical protein